MQTFRGSGKPVSFSPQGIEIDYIRPPASFAGLKNCNVDGVGIEMRKACNFNNMRLFPAVENRVKGGKYDTEAYAKSKECVAIDQLENRGNRDVCRTGCTSCLRFQ